MTRKVCGTCEHYTKGTTSEKIDYCSGNLACLRSKRKYLVDRSVVLYEDGGPLWKEKSQSQSS